MVIRPVSWLTWSRVKERGERADHAVRAMKKGALGVHEVSGPEPPGVFKVLTGGAGGTGGH
jgi:hypothetical protein